MTEPQTEDAMEIQRDHHTCPVWIGRLLVSPLRRLVENPSKILAPFVSPGSTAIDVGTAMGFHSMDLARLVGPQGRVICLDIQQKMLDGLVKRARRKGLDGVIEARLCSQESLMLDEFDGAAELVTAFNVIHETAYPDRFIGECAAALKLGGHLLVVEPRGHVSSDDFAQTIATAEKTGLTEKPAPTVWRSRTALFTRV